MCWHIHERLAHVVRSVPTTSRAIPQRFVCLCSVLPESSLLSVVVQNVLCAFPLALAYPHSTYFVPAQRLFSPRQPLASVLMGA